jgi:hypothetical protein
MNNKYNILYVGLGLKTYKYYIIYMSKTPEEIKALTDIKKIVIDFTRDILVTFPEQKDSLHPHLQTLINDVSVSVSEANANTNVSVSEANANVENTNVSVSEANTNVDEALLYVYTHCKKIYPERFFDILYQNNEVFKTKIEFLPGMDFSLLWLDKDLSEKSRETIWKYLQLLLFTLVSTISDGSSFGDTAKLFEAIDENEFKNKLEETISQMQNVFAASGEVDAEGEEGDAEGDAEQKPNINLNDLPDPKDIHEHVTGMMNGKLGNLAREIAEETAADLNMDLENAGSVNDVFKKLFQNPTKLMSLVKNVGNKLDNKLKSGDMKESELLQEASDIMQKMKSMPGMGDLQSMLAKMGMGHMMPGGGGGGKVNTNAMQANLDRNLKAAKNKERLLAKLEQKKAVAATNSLHSAGVDQSGRQNLVFSKGEEVERSMKSSADNVKPTADNVKPSADNVKPSAKKKNKKKKKTNAVGANAVDAVDANAVDAVGANAVDAVGTNTNVVGTNVDGTESN